MPPPEVQVTCSGCGHRTMMPFASVRRDSSYCGRCGKRLEFDNVVMPANTGGPTNTRQKPKKSSRPGKRH